MDAGKQLLICAAGLALLGQSAMMAQSSDALFVPSEPYAWHNVVIGGGGFVTGIIFHPRQPGLAYARTDVGGAYRWDDAGKNWVPLTDWLGPADNGLTGIESLAVDPNDTNRVYLAAGIYTGVNAAILRSDDQGRTWRRTDVPFRMGGNETGRFNGERLAVDPNDGDILFFGSRRDGLWKSTDRAVTWRKVESFPAGGAPTEDLQNAAANNFHRRFNQPPSRAGIVFVQFIPDSGRPGNPTPVIYAGVSVRGTSLFRSTDGGITWQAVPGQPTGLCPNHAALASDGMMYLTYGREPGPNTMTDGAVWKFNLRSGDWADVTPLKPADADQPFGYGAVAVDAAHPETVVATTFCCWKPHDEIFRSTNAGATWTPLLARAVFDYSFAPYTGHLKPHWMGAIQIDPFDSGHVLFTTGYGIWSCADLSAADAGRPTHWTFADRGLEETVPLALISPPTGAHLLSGVGDIDGFRHDDLDRSPAEGAFPGPRYSNTEDLAFAGLKPNVVVRTGTGGNGAIRAALSTDEGKTWAALNSEPPDSAGAGTIAISAEGQTIVWSPRRSVPWLTTDRGTHWTACAGLAEGIRVIADAKNPAWFYAFNPQTGRLLISTNRAVSFLPTRAALPASGQAGNRPGFNGANDAMLAAAPDATGDLWLGTRNAGLFHSTNAGASFTQPGDVSEVDCLGFGKPAPGGRYPALYLAGTIGPVPGIFCSNDAGTTWIRINDDRHQFGSISHITGDPRIYGRVYFTTGGRGVIYGDLPPPPTQSSSRDF